MRRTSQWVEIKIIIIIIIIVIEKVPAPSLVKPAIKPEDRIIRQIISTY